MMISGTDISDISEGMKSYLLKEAQQLMRDEIFFRNYNF